jgi:hypothetical protein
MDYTQQIGEQVLQPENLEVLYGQAVKADEAGAFAEAVEKHYAAQPDYLLLAAWHFRLAKIASVASRWTANWAAAIPLAVINGLIVWLLSGPQASIKLSEAEYPLFLLLWAPVSAVMVMAYLSLGNRPRAARAVVLSLALPWLF